MSPTPETARTAVVTGATSGIGRAVALDLARAGFQVLAVGRNEARGRAVEDELGQGHGRFLAADLQTVAGVRGLAASVRDSLGRLDVLINNAAVTLRHKALTADGIERTFAINTVAPFLLTRELIEPLAAAAGRVVNIATEVLPRYRLEVAGLADPKRFSMFSAYTRSKLALIMLTMEQARRYADRGVDVVAVHPGVVFDTRLSAEMPRLLMRLGPLAARLMRRRTSTAEEAAGWVRQAATAPVEPGTLYSEGVTMARPRQAEDPAVRAALWQHLEQLTIGG
jgi:retinol dehydrogenase 14